MDDSNGTAFIQCFIPDIMPLIIEKFDNFKINEKALSIINIAIHDGLFHPVDAVPTLVAATAIFHSDTAKCAKIRQFSMGLLEHLGRKHREFAFLSFEKGINLAFEKQANNSSLVLGYDAGGISIFQDYYRWAYEKNRAKCTALKTFVDEIDKTVCPKFEFDIFKMTLLFHVDC